MSTPNVLPEETRLQVAVVAGASERANRPRYLVILGLVLVAVAMVFTVVRAGSLAAARSEIRQEENRAARIADLVTQIRAAAAAQRVDAQPSDPEAGRKIERLAVAAGLPTTLRVTQGSIPAGDARFDRKRYSASFRALDAAQVLDWIASATGPNDANLTGVELSEIKLKPLHAQKDAGWDTTVVFTRLERKP